MAEHEMELTREVCAKCYRTRMDIEDDPRPCGARRFTVVFAPGHPVLPSNVHSFLVDAEDEQQARVMLGLGWPGAIVLGVYPGDVAGHGHRPLKAPG